MRRSAARRRLALMKISNLKECTFTIDLAFAPGRKLTAGGGTQKGTVIDYEDGLVKVTVNGDTRYVPVQHVAYFVP
jgi:hypothetical protein